MLFIDKKDWKHQLFLFCLGLRDSLFTGIDTSHRYEDGTNLCHFVRVIVVYGPLTVLLNLLTVGFVLTAVAGLPVYYVGPAGYLWLLLFLFLAGAFLGAAVYGLVRYVRSRPKKPESPVSPKRSARVVTLIGEYIVAKKKSVCPLITFKSEETRVETP